MYQTIRILLSVSLLLIGRFGPCAATAENHAVLPQSHASVRAAIDFGSGAVKLQVGIVENNNISKTFLERHISLNLTEDVAAHGGSISKEMQQRALAIIKQLKDEAVASCKGQVQFSGVATAVFRKTPNGMDVLKLFEQQVGIPFHILSQDEEGKLGFMTAKALYPEIPEEQLIAWDSGNGSFQMSAKAKDSFNIYQGPLGYGTVRVLLSKEIRKGPVFLPHESGNPVSRMEAKILAEHIRALLPVSPDWLQDMLAKKAVVATFGEGKSLFPVIAESLAAVNGKAGYEAKITRDDLRNMCDLFLEQDDKLFDAMGIYNRTSSASVFLLTMMEHLGIEEIHFKRAVGNTSGILISPQFWIH